MLAPILTTKLYTPPTRPDWVSRQRLVKRLDQGLRRKLTLVCAPAGYGKTTLITDWLHGLPERLNTSPRVAWLSLDEEDNDLVRFLTYLVTALQQIEPRIGQGILPLFEAPQLPAPNHLMTLLINDLANVGDQAILVLNDYHVIDQPDIHGAMAFFLDHLPPQIHVIVATREEPNLPLARLRVQWQVTEIRLQDLRFTAEETAAFLNQTMSLDLSAEDVKALEGRTEGWIAGLQMAALSLRGDQTQRIRKPDLDAVGQVVSDFGGTHQYVIDYLAAEVLRQQPTSIRAFLRQTSILDRLSAPLCDAVTGQQDSRSFLAQLEQANLFLIQLDDQRQWYRYHSLFADFLRAELAGWEQRALHQRASQWFEAHNFLPEAFKHALAAEDYTSAERLIRSSVEEVFSRGGFTTLLGWLNTLPDSIVRSRSDLSAYKAWILYLRGRIAEAEMYAASASEAERPDDPPLQRGMLLGFRAYLAINRGQAAQALALGKEALALLDDTRSFFRTTALSHVGQAQRLVGDRAAAIQSLRQAVALGQQFNHYLITAEALGYLALLLYQQGELREALLLCENAISQYIDANNQPLPIAGLVYIPLGVLYVEMNELERAEHYLVTGIALCQQMGTLYFTLVGQRILAKLYCARGNLESAWQTLAAARHLAAQSENQRRIRMIDAVTAELQLRQGQTAEAARTMADWPTDPAARSEQENLTVARLHLAQGELNETEELLRQLEGYAQQQGRLGSLITVRVLQTLVDHSQGRPSAIDRLDEALSLAARLGYRRVFLNELQTLAPLLVERRHIAPDFVDSLLETTSKPVSFYDTLPAALPRNGAANQALVEPLSETQLTILGLVAEGLSNQDIADKLSITVGTTKWHLNQIYSILDVSSRTQAIAKARHLNLL